MAQVRQGGGSYGGVRISSFHAFCRGVEGAGADADRDTLRRVDMERHLAVEMSIAQNSAPWTSRTSPPAPGKHAKPILL